MRSFSLETSRRIGLLTAGVVMLLIGGAVSFGVSAQSSTALTLVSTEWPPFTNAPGKPRFALDLVEAAFGRIGVTAKTTIVSFRFIVTS